MQDTRPNEPDSIEEGSQPVNGFAASQINQTQNTLKDLDLENLELRWRSWRLHNKGTVPIGITLSGVGGVILFLSYTLTSSILTFMGLGLVFWGVLIIYISPARHVHADVLNSISSSMQKCVDEVVTYMGYNGEAIFFHPKSLTGLGQGHVFITHSTAKDDGTVNAKLEALNLLPYNSETKTPSIYLHPRGMFLVAPSQGVVDLFEKELEINLATVDLSYVQEALPKLLIDDLKVVDEISIEDTDSKSVVMSFHGGPCGEMCIYFERNTKLGKNLGCPLCSAVALVVSKITGKPVMIKQTKIADDNKVSTTFSVISS